MLKEVTAPELVSVSLSREEAEVAILCHTVFIMDSPDWERWDRLSSHLSRITPRDWTVLPGYRLASISRDKVCR